MTPSPLSSAAHADAMRESRSSDSRRPLASVLEVLDLDTDGRLAPEILRAYRTHGFYVFENVVTPDEISQLRRAVNDVIDRAPARPKSELDMQGRPAIGRDHAIEPFVLAKPLSDPWGGTTLLAGRHPTKMAEPPPPPTPRSTSFT